MVEEAERRVAVTIVACHPHWGHAPLLTRDTEGHTHVSTTPHTTHARAMQRGWGMVRGCWGVVRGGGAGRRGTDQRERTAGDRGGPKTQKVTFHKTQESEGGNPHRGHNKMVGVHVTKGSTTQNSMRIHIKTSTLSPPKIEGIFGRFLGDILGPSMSGIVLKPMVSSNTTVRNYPRGAGLNLSPPSMNPRAFCTFLHSNRLIRV